METARRLKDEDLRDAIEGQFKTMYEMFDRDQVFKSFTKYGEGYALDSHGNINIVFSYSGPISNPIKVVPREITLSESSSDDDLNVQKIESKVLSNSKVSNY